VSATREIAAVGISTLALAISFYGVWDKRRDTRRQLQIRLSEVVDELNAVALEQQKHEAEAGKPGRALGAAYNARRELLCREGVALADLLGDSVTDSEYRFLAVALDQVGDKAGSEALWRKAVNLAASGSVFRLFVLRGYARYLFAQGAEDRGRMLYQQALELVSGDSDDSLWLKGETYLAWANAERDSGAAGPEVKRLMDAAEREFAQLRFGPRRQAGKRLLAAPTSEHPSMHPELDG
jgi:tetratricopeptide (TPR) repeat protein